MEVKRCENCLRDINFISNAMYDKIKVFCDKDCLDDYIQELKYDNPDPEPQYDRNDLD